MTENIERFAQKQLRRLLGKLAKQVKRAARRPDEEAIHDLRVSIRRLSQLLREFRQFFSHGRSKKALDRLRKLMDLAAEVRNRDIALTLIGEPDSPISAALSRERLRAIKRLTTALAGWRLPDV